jgi:3-oxoacyl-[acyl-carrier protein] reductase
MGINSRIAIVTGAAKGIGRSIALTFAKKGIVPVIADINKNGADMVADEIRKTGVNSISYEADVSNVEQISKMVEDIDQMFGRVDILVNNAGILDTTSIEDMDENVWDRVMNINVKSVMFLSQKVLKYMKKTGMGQDY